MRALKEKKNELGLLCASLASLSFGSAAMAIHVPLQQPTSQFSQGGFPISATNDNVYSFADAGGAGWADDVGGTPSNIAAYETVSNLDGSPGTTLRFNLFHGGFGSHTIGRYRISYTTDDRSTFADGLNGSGDVTATWIPLKPIEAFSSGGATLNIIGNDILASGTNPNRSTDTVYAQVATLAPITGIRLEALEDPSFPTNGPGRAAGNGNFVLREFDVAAFKGNRVALANATAQATQGGFSPDRIIDGTFNFENDFGGWADATGVGVGGTPSNIATFETVKNIGDSEQTELTAEIFSGGFGVHTLGKFRISATTADRSLFADGNDNGGAGVGTEAGIWQVLMPLSAVSDNASTLLSIDGSGMILASGASAEFELYTLRFLTSLQGITGFRLETIEDASLPGNGPGRAAGNGNFVIREFTVFATTVPEPASLALLAMGGAALLRRRRSTV